MGVILVEFDDAVVIHQLADEDELRLSLGVAANHVDGAVDGPWVGVVSIFVLHLDQLADPGFLCPLCCFPVLMKCP